MPKINLLPIKAARRSETARNELLGLLAVFALVLFGSTFGIRQSMKTWMQPSRASSKMTKEIKNLSQEAKRVEEFGKRRRFLEDKQNIIEKLKRQKQGPAKHCTIWRLRLRSSTKSG